MAVKHGHCLHGKQTRTWIAWRSMWQRTTDPKQRSYPEYKDVTVCYHWREFTNFLADMGECPPGMTLDRWPNNKGGYEPGNCRWATPKEQANNRRSNRLLIFNGKTQTLQQWGEQTGIGWSAICQRIDKLGWTVERALTTPLRSGNVDCIAKT